jgi:hypothetical protein
MGLRFDLIKQAVLARLENVSVVQSDRPERVTLSSTGWTTADLPLDDSVLVDRLVAEIKTRNLKHLVDIGCYGVILKLETSEPSYVFWVSYIVIRPQIGVYH